jgi:WD40 repeat protein/mono/diheme cytochrome c family protein
MRSFREDLSNSLGEREMNSAARRFQSRSLFALAFLLSVSVAHAQPTSESLAERSEKILRQHCHSCHGLDGSIEGGMNFILDARRLVARKMVVPKKPGQSALLQRIRDGEMPPADAETEITAAEVEVLRRWVTEGAARFGEEVGQRKFHDNNQVLQWIADDLAKIAPIDKPFTRYFTIAHLYNQGLSNDELRTYRNGLSKLVNSLSWNAEISVPAVVDAQKILLRIDLRHYNWTDEIWQEIIDAYPYGVVVDSKVGQAVYQQTQTTVPMVRADWFVALAAQPPLYHKILDLPLRDWLLEKQLGIRVESNIRAGRVVRAGFNSSGVSRHNRLIERHETDYGAYWKSYDFSGSNGRKNLFAHPLGPRGSESFQHAGGEIIFNLPNGLQAYFLTDERGRRIDKGPTEIVSDPKRPDRAVVNGLSCMSCHAKGMIFKADQIREHVTKNPAAFDQRDRQQILKLYPEQTELARLLEEDRQRFRTAVEKTGAQFGGTEPVVALALRFESELDLRVASAESGVKEATLIEKLRTSQLLARKLGVLNVEGGTVQRQVFVEAIRDVVRELKLGTVRDHSGVVRQFAGDGGRLAFSPDGKLLAASGGGRAIRIWDAVTTELKSTLPPHPDAVRDISFSADGKLLASCCEDSHIRLWNVSTGELLHKFSGHQGLVFDIAFTGDGKSILSGGVDSTMRKWSIESGRQERVYSAHRSWVRSVDSDAAGRRWISGGNDATFIIWDAGSGKPLWKIQAHKAVITSVAFVPGSDRVVTAAYDNVVRVWDLKTRKLLQTLIGHQKPVTSISVSPDGRWVASVSKDASVRIWDLHNGGEVHRLQRDGVQFGVAQFSPDSRRIATTDDEGILRIWGIPELLLAKKGLLR